MLRVLEKNSNRYSCLQLSSFNYFKIAFFLILLVQTVIVISIPVIHQMNDSGWYYMSVHFVNTGEYLTESRYPSFDQPSQYYPFFGYSFLLFLCNKLALLLSIETATVIKYIQFILYVCSGLLVKQIVFLTTHKIHLAYAIGVCFLLYYPNFNYVNLVMSENYATFLAVLVCYLFVKTQVKLTYSSAIFLFVTAGYFILVKPVFLPVSIAAIILYLVNVIELRKKSHVYFVVFICVFPITQSLFSKQHYGNYRLQTGFGWHIWDRVIFYDKQIPESSEHLERLKQIYNKENKSVSYGYWWDVTKDLSEFGYKELETQKICEQIAIDGIASDPFKFLLNTFIICYDNFLMHNTEDRVYTNANEYLENIKAFSNERQHKPLTNILSKQNFYSSYYLNDEILNMNSKYAAVSNIYNIIFHNSFVAFLFLIIGIHTIFLLLKSRFKTNRIQFFVWFIAFSIIFGSNLAEYPQSRLMQPAVIFVIIAIVLKVHYFLNLFANKNNHSKV